MLTDMDSTTLVTFLLECSHRVKLVELFGSWDNFSHPYSMKRDTRRGGGVWNGCHRFKDIVCDGDLTSTCSRRDGALKMGGVYWFYYRLDGDIDYTDPSLPSTTSCPLLPGQPVNVLDVPKRALGNSCPIDPYFAVTTMNPDDKYKKQRAVPERKRGCSRRESGRPGSYGFLATAKRPLSLDRAASVHAPVEQGVFPLLRRAKSLEHPPLPASDIFGPRPTSVADDRGPAVEMDVGWNANRAFPRAHSPVNGSLDDSLLLQEEIAVVTPHTTLSSTAAVATERFGLSRGKPSQGSPDWSLSWSDPDFAVDSTATYRTWSPTGTMASMLSDISPFTQPRPYESDVGLGRSSRSLIAFGPMASSPDHAMGIKDERPHSRHGSPTKHDLLQLTGSSWLPPVSETAEAQGPDPFFEFTTASFSDERDDSPGTNSYASIGNTPSEFSSQESEVDGLQSPTFSSHSPGSSGWTTPSCLFGQATTTLDKTFSLGEPLDMGGLTASFDLLDTDGPNRDSFDTLFDRTTPRLGTKSSFKVGFAGYSLPNRLAASDATITRATPGPTQDAISTPQTTQLTHESSFGLLDDFAYLGDALS